MSRMHLKFNSPSRTDSSKFNSPLRTEVSDDKENQIPGSDSFTPTLCKGNSLNDNPRKLLQTFAAADFNSPKKCTVGSMDFLSPASREDLSGIICVSNSPAIDRLTCGSPKSNPSPHFHLNSPVRSVSGTKLFSPSPEKSSRSPLQKSVIPENLKKVTKKIFSPCKNESFSRSPFKDGSTRSPLKEIDTNVPSPNFSNYFQFSHTDSPKQPVSEKKYSSQDLPHFFYHFIHLDLIF